MCKLLYANKCHQVGHAKKEIGQYECEKKLKLQGGMTQRDNKNTGIYLHLPV